MAEGMGMATEAAAAGAAREAESDDAAMAIAEGKAPGEEFDDEWADGVCVVLLRRGWPATTRSSCGRSSGR